MSEETEMIKFINKVTGTEMWVAEDRVEEYKAAGHKPAVTSPIMIERPAARPAAKKSKK